MQPASFGQAYTKEELSVVQKLLERRLRPEEIAWREGPNEGAPPFSILPRSLPPHPCPCPPPLISDAISRCFYIISHRYIVAMVPYLPADWVVNEANRIFGRDGWASSVSQVTQDFVRAHTPSLCIPSPLSCSLSWKRSRASSPVATRPWCA